MRRVLGFVVAGVAAIVAVILGLVALVWAAVDDSAAEVRTAVVAAAPSCTQGVDPANPGVPLLDCVTDIELDGDVFAVRSGNTLRVGQSVEVVLVDGRPARTADTLGGGGLRVAAAGFAVVALVGLVVALTDRSTATSSPRS